MQSSATDARHFYANGQLALCVKSSVCSLVNGAELKRSLRCSSDVLIDFADNLWAKLAEPFVNRTRNTRALTRIAAWGINFRAVFIEQIDILVTRVLSFWLDALAYTELWISLSLCLVEIINLHGAITFARLHIISVDLLTSWTHYLLYTGYVFRITCLRIHVRE